MSSFYISSQQASVVKIVWRFLGLVLPSMLVKLLRPEIHIVKGISLFALALKNVGRI